LPDGIEVPKQNKKIEILKKEKRKDNLTPINT